MKNKILSAIGIGIIMQWLSLFLSYKKLPNFYSYKDMNAPIATGGFLIKFFEYPVPPMGNDMPPPEAWPWFFLNLGIWVILGFLIAGLLKEKLGPENNRIIGSLAVILTLIGIVYIVLKFD